MAFIIEHKSTRSVHSHSLPLNHILRCATYSTLWSTSILSSAMFPIKAKLIIEENGNDVTFPTFDYSVEAFPNEKCNTDVLGVQGPKYDFQFRVGIMTCCDSISTISSPMNYDFAIISNTNEQLSDFLTRPSESNNLLLLFTPPPNNGSIYMCLIQRRFVGWMHSEYYDLYLQFGGFGLRVNL